MTRLPIAINLHKASKTLYAEIRGGRGISSARRIPAGAFAVGRGSGSWQSDPAIWQARGRPHQIEPAGQYALKLTFDDGHDSGLFTWDYLYQLAQRQEQLWDDYLAELKAAGKTRDPSEQIIKLML